MEIGIVQRSGFSDTIKGLNSMGFKYLDIGPIV